MPELILIVCLLALVVALGVVRLLRARRAAAAGSVASSWGRVQRVARRDQPVDAWWRHFGAPHWLDDGTWADLDLERIFEWADGTFTAIGAQTLYHWLRTPDPSLQVASERRAMSERLTADDALRVRVQARLAKLGDAVGWDVAKMLTLTPPSLPLPQLAYGALAVGFLVALVGALLFTHPITIAALLLFAVLNPVLAVVSARRTDGHMPNLRDIRALVNAAADVHAMSPGRLRGGELERDIEAARAAVATAGIGLGAPSGAGGLAESVLEYARSFLLAEARAYLRMTRAVAAARDSVHRALRFLGETDASLALAHLRRRETFVIPRLHDGAARVEARALRHPLVGDAVPNDVTLEPPGLLVTGSNMAGKSTFLRTLGVNVLLAQTLGVACASALAVSPLRVVSSMGADDDLVASVSLYQAEVLRLRELLEQHTGASPSLVLLDEVFRGTNPHDRVAASAAVIWALAENNVVVAATHDLGLASRTGRDFELGHFAETIEEDEVAFDYRLREGTSRATNALDLLARLGYPDAVLERAAGVRASLGEDPLRDAV